MKQAIRKGLLLGLLLLLPSRAACFRIV